MIYIFFLCLILGSQAIPERTHNQEALAGAWNYNHLREPETVSDCGDDQVQIEIFTFVGQFLEKADKASIGQVNALEQEAMDFIESLPIEYRECLSTNQEVLQIMALYGIYPTTDPQEVKQKIVKYVLSHFLLSKKVIHSANVHWNNEHNYYATGYELADFAKKALA